MSPRFVIALSALAAGLAVAPAVAQSSSGVTLGRPVALTAPPATIGKPVALPAEEAGGRVARASSWAEVAPFLIVDRDQHQPLPPPFPAPIRPFPKPMHNNLPCDSPELCRVLPPPMIGDLPGYQAVRSVVVRTTLTGGPADGALLTDQFSILAPVPNRGAFKIAENESPVPVDRAYVTYNYYQGAPVRVLGQTSTFTAANGITTPLRSTLAATAINDPTAPLVSLNHTQISSADVHREVLGLEKTILDGSVSVGIRLPFYNLNQSVSSLPNSGQLFAFNGGNAAAANVNVVSNGLDSGGIGDLSILLKVALLNDPNSGSVVSTGLMTTAPTGEKLTLGDRTMRSVLLQPFLGGLTTCNDWYFHGFSSILVGTDASEPLLMFNDVGVGYILKVGAEDCFLRAIIPTLECHVTTPLRKGEGGQLQIADLATLTGGVHFDMACGSLLTVGASTPMTGPNPFSFELAVYYNWRY